MVEEMEGWPGGGPMQGQADDSFFSPNNHHVSESEAEDLDLAKLVQESLLFFVFPW